MKLYRSLAAALLAAVMILPLPLQAGAAGVIDTSREVSLEVKLHCEDQVLPGAQVSLYRVSQVDAWGELTPLPEFSGFSQLLDIRGEDARRWQEAAAQLETYILSQQLAPTETAMTDPGGAARFPSGEKKLAQGLYLVVGVRHSQGSYVYSTAPFFVMLPSRDRSGWDYSGYAEAKAEESEKLISLRVMKKWNDKYWESKRPPKIEVTLYRDAEPYDTVLLPLNGRWVYQWAGLEAAHNWWVEEKPVPGYQTQVYREGNTFVVENTYHKSGTEEPTLPQTGQLWWPVAALLLAGLLLIWLGVLRRKGKCNGA